MMPFKRKRNTHIIIKIDDAEKYLTGHQLSMLDGFLKQIDGGRKQNGKKPNNYYVVNTDEPYADEVFEVIKKGEIKKEKS